MRRVGWKWLAAGLVAWFVGSAHAQGPWQPQESGTDGRLRGLHAVDGQTAWATGSKGVVIRTTDGGKTWVRRPVTGGEALDFRDVHAFDADNAVILSIGPGEASRLYRTVDGGETWREVKRNLMAEDFYDALVFLDAHRGLVVGDPVGGRFRLVGTTDGGQTWGNLPTGGMPGATEKEAAFAASGTCVAALGDRWVLVVTGGPGQARAFGSVDQTRTWTVSDLPIDAGVESAGAFSAVILDARKAVAVGGDYQKPELATGVAAWTSDGGKTWNPASTGPRGYRSCVAVVPGGAPGRLVAVGPTGSDASDDGGKTWFPLSDDGFDTVSFAADGAGWASGEGGRIARFVGPWPVAER